MIAYITICTDGKGNPNVIFGRGTSERAAMADAVKTLREAGETVDGLTTIRARVQASRIADIDGMTSWSRV